MKYPNKVEVCNKMLKSSEFEVSRGLNTWFKRRAGYAEELLLILKALRLMRGAGGCCRLRLVSGSFQRYSSHLRRGILQ